ncbi:hypothetical protein Tco_1366426, partial [Tanacetum coccineum]
TMTTTAAQQVALNKALICPRLPNQDFDELLLDEEIISFIKGMYYKKNVDFVELLWEDFVFQIDNRDTKTQEKMYYPRFTKAVIYHFITKDKTISMRNKLFMHTAQDDCVLSTMRFVSKSEDFQVYGALLPEVMTNQKMRNSRAYNTYLAYATRAATPKKARKFKKPTSPSKKRTLVTLEEEKPEPAKKFTLTKKSSRKQSTGVQIRDTPGMSVSKNKAPATTDKSKGIDLLSKAALLEEAQVKKVLTRSQQEITIHQAGSSGDGTGSKPGVLDEPKGKSVDTNKGTGDSGDEANVQGDDEDFQDSDDEPHQADDERTYSENQETNDDEKESDDEFEHTPLNYVLADDEINDESKDVDKEEYDRIEKELYGDVNVRLTDVEQDDEDEEGAHMTDDVHVQVEQTQEQTTGIQEESGPEMASVQGQYVVQATTTSILAIYNAITESTETEVVSMIDINVQHEVLRTSPLLTIPVNVIPKHIVFNPSEIVTTALVTTITSLLLSLFPNLHRSTPIPTPTNTEATTSTPFVLESESLNAIHLRLLGILYNRLNSVSIVVSSASIVVSTGRRFIIVSTGSVKKLIMLM